MQPEHPQIKQQTNQSSASHLSAKKLDIEKLMFKKVSYKKISEQNVKIPAKVQKIIIRPPPKAGLNLNQSSVNKPLSFFGRPEVKYELKLKQSINPYVGNTLKKLIQQQKTSPIFFNDDEKFVKEIRQGEQGKVQIALLAQRSQVKLKQHTVLPAMCRITTSGGQRTSLDLICVIDVSGSMNGQKLNLVKETMRVLIQALNPSDRLSIITFNDEGRRLCPLKTVSQQNMVILLDIVNRLESKNGTSIMAGMQLALKTVRDKRYTNKGTSIFLLSDGQDKRADISLQKALQSQQYENLGIFNIHSFGFGGDHDEDLMSAICTMKDGSFYYIQELNTLDQAFCNALGGMISLIASQVSIQIESVAKGLLKPVVVSKVFENKWEKKSPESFRIHLTQLMSEITKQFIFELNIPAIQAEVQDINREYVVLKALMKVKGIEGEYYESQSILSLTLINFEEQIAEWSQNVEVIESYLRVKSAEAIKESLKKVESKRFEEAQKHLSEAIKSIEQNKKARPEKLSLILSNLQNLRFKCSQQGVNQARKLMVSSEICMLNMTGLQFSNKIQSSMVQERRLKKSVQSLENQK